jgi:hypothetical protein
LIVKRCSNCGKSFDSYNDWQILCPDCFNTDYHDDSVFWKAYFKEERRRIKTKRKQLSTLKQDELISQYEELIQEILRQLPQSDEVQLKVSIAYEKWMSSGFSLVDTVFDLEKEIFVINYYHNLKQLFDAAKKGIEHDISSMRSKIEFPFSIHEECRDRTMGAGLIWNRIRKPIEYQKWQDSKKKRFHLLSKFRASITVMKDE